MQRNELPRCLTVRRLQQIVAVQPQGRPDHLPDIRIIICD